MVPVVALAWKVEARAPAARVRLNAIAAESHVIDRVSTCDHPRNQRRNLQVRADPARLVDRHMPADQPLQAGTLRELQHRRQASGGIDDGATCNCMTEP